MQRILQVFLYAVWLPLQLLVISAIVRSRAWREFPFVAIYCVAGFCASLLELGVYVARLMKAHRPRTLAYYYWVNEGVLQILIFVAVISLVYHATSTLSNRTLIRRALVACAILFASVSVAVHYDSTILTSHWMTLVSRDLSLCTAIVDLALWMLLVAFRPGDNRLLLLSGGLGVQFTGEAIGHSLRMLSNYSRATVLAGDAFVLLADFACLYFWWQAFRVRAPRPVETATASLKS